VRTGGRVAEYQVLVGSGLLASLPNLLREHAPAHRYAVITDSTVAGLYGTHVLERLRASGLAADLFSFPAGERHKTRAHWADLIDGLLAEGYGRDSCVVALGGGVVGDLAGFVAATYMRGVPVVQVPTSLVAMIDASIGGKTGVDVEVGKNLVGAFHAPNLVVADPEVIRTLPRAERAQGLVEAVKHGAIMDGPYLENLELNMPALLDGEVEPVERAVARSVELKAEVVSADERESGRREILNFGHTLGHAVEGVSGYGMPHGAAVAVGMFLEARLGEELGVTEVGVAERLARIAGTLEIGIELPDGAAPNRIMSYLGLDKKARHGHPRFVLLSRIGLVHRTDDRWSHVVDENLILDLLNSMAAKG
jgi:3-dehydroquinate synthase